MYEKIPNNTQSLNFYFVNDIKYLCTDKTYEKSCLVIHTYNDKKKNLVLKHLPKILKVSQGIDSCFIAIIQENDNNNVRFYLQDIKQAYIKIASNINPDFYV